MFSIAPSIQIIKNITIVILLINITNIIIVIIDHPNDGYQGIETGGVLVGDCCCQVAADDDDDHVDDYDDGDIDYDNIDLNDKTWRFGNVADKIR